jgi:SAM-dependent methyltransferase
MSAAFRNIVACRLCDSSRLSQFIDFGAVPLGNDLRTSAADAQVASSYPLVLMRCGDCGHFQLGHAVDPKLLYATNYTYLSGVGASFIKHLESYPDWVAANCKLPAKPFVVDIGSNDGTCLKAFQSRGYTVCGVDPASLPAKIANENGVETINAFFDADIVAEIRRRHGSADFVTSHNVLAHVDDLAAVFRNIRDLLKQDGYFAFEVGYFRQVLESGHFDTIYHEHLDYHHAAPLVRHLSALGFDVLDVSVNAVQGGSIRLLSRNTGKGTISESVRAFLAAESKSVLHDQDFLANWRKRIETSMTAFRELLKTRARDGRAIAGYGAPTKATLLMKMAHIGSREISYVVEDNPYKTGRYLPGSGVPIKPRNELQVDTPDVVVLFAWNFADDIVRKLSGTFAKPVEVVVPLPELRTIVL